MALDAAGRRLRARMAAHISWSRTDSPSARTAPARAGLQARFEREVDPEGKLSTDDLKRRVESARRAYYLRLAYKSAKARSRKLRFTVKAEDEAEAA